MLYVNAKMGRCGLGNKLFVWARAEAFAYDTCASMLMPRFWQPPSFGAILRGERCLRTNWGDFDCTHAGYLGCCHSSVIRWRSSAVDEYNWSPSFKDGVVNFFGMGRDSFGDVLRHHEHIVMRLRLITKRSILQDVETIAAVPFIGVHIRRGDFGVAGVMTDDDWYVLAIRRAIDMAGHLPVRIFSDGHAQELEFVRRAFPNEDVVIMPPAKPMHDIWTLSKSSVMVGSSRSSFSNWAVLLGQMPSIWAAKNAPESASLYLDAKCRKLVVL